MAEANWSRVGAIWTVIAAIANFFVGVAGLLLMYYLDRRTKSSGSLAMISIGGWWPAGLIAAAIIAGGLLHIIASRMLGQGEGQPGDRSVRPSKPQWAEVQARLREGNDANILKSSPKLVVTCPNDPKRRIIVSNEGQTTALNILVGPLVHQEEHRIWILNSSFGSIRPAGIDERTMTVDQRQSNTGGSLWDAMRLGCPLLPSVDYVMVEFDDVNQNRFVQKFDLTSQVDGSVMWKAEGTKLCPNPV